MITLGRMLMVAGAIVLIVGGVLYLSGRMGLPFGRLPGDIRIATDNVTCVIPLATSIILSIALTIIINLVLRFFSR